MKIKIGLAISWRRSRSRAPIIPSHKAQQALKLRVFITAKSQGEKNADTTAAIRAFPDSQRFASHRRIE